MRLVKGKGDGHGSKPFKREFARRGNNHSAAEKCLSDRDSTLCRTKVLARRPFDPAAQRLRSMRSGGEPLARLLASQQKKAAMPASTKEPLASAFVLVFSGAA